MPPTSGPALRPLLTPAFLNKLLRELHGNDPHFKTAILHKDFSMLRMSLLLGEVSISANLDGTQDGFSFEPGAKHTLLHAIASNGDVPFLCELLRLGAPIDTKNARKDTPLIIACNLLASLQLQRQPVISREADAAMDYRTRRIIRILVEHNANVNVVNEKGETPLVLLTRSEQTAGPLTRLLIKYGADPKLILPSMDPQTRAQVLAISNDPRPLPKCPCFSGKLLHECHNGPELLSYPLESVCPCCNSLKPFGKCCKGRKIEFIEAWDSKNKRLVRWKNPRGQILKRNFDGVPPERLEDVKNIIEAENRKKLDGSVDPKMMRQIARYRVVDVLLPTGQLDTAFALAMTQVDFEPQPWGRVISRMESKKRQADFNIYVDRYIECTKKDTRSRIEIERAAKIGISGGALYRTCEAEECAKMEGRDIQKLRVCSKCKMTVYCSEACQQAGWKSHKKVCGSVNQLEQRLPSQIALLAFVKTLLGYQERVDVSDVDLREMLRNRPEDFRERPYM